MMTKLETVAIDELAPADNNPRRDVGDVSDLQASIATLGLLEPLVVAPNGKGYVVVCGHRRLAAAKAAGVQEIPVLVRTDLDERGRLEAMLVENLQRSDLTPLEEASGYRRLVELGLSQRDLAARIGRSQSHVSKRLALLELPEIAHRELDAGRITLEDALALKPVTDDPELCAKVIAERLGDDDPWAPSIEDIVRDELAAREKAEKEAKARAVLEEQGVLIVDDAKTRVWKLGKGYGYIDLKLSKHKHEPCHAGYIDRWSLKPQYGCTDPGRHKPKGASELKLPKGSGKEIRQESGDSAAAKRAKALAKAALEASKARRALLTKIAQGRVSKDDAFTFAAGYALERLLHEEAVLACAFLGLEPKREKRMSGGTYSAWDGALRTYAKKSPENLPLRTYAKKSPENLRRAVAAIAFAQAEASLRHWHDWRDRKAHFTLLRRHGYKATEVERRKLEGKNG